MISVFCVKNQDTSSGIVQRTRKGMQMFSQKEFPGKEKRNFLINRTEYPRLAERVRCLCVECDATWGPPCQALVTRLCANRRRRTKDDRLAQNNSNNTNNTNNTIH